MGVRDVDACALRVLPGLEQSAQERNAEERDRRRDHAEVQRRGGSDRDRARREQRAPEQSDAPRAVDAGHDRSAVGALDDDGVRVVRDVEQSAGESQGDEPGGERDEAVRERGRDEGGPEHRRAVAHDAACPESPHRDGREAGAEEEPDREAGEREAELARRHVSLFLDRRQARPERPRHDRVQDEGRDDAPPRRTQVAFSQRAVM